jgi:hypothetical protein
MRARMNKEKVGVCLTKVVYKFVSVSCTQQVLRYLHMKIVNVLGALTHENLLYTASAAIFTHENC